MSTPTATYHFPPDFRWGVATASHQVEGHNMNNQWWAWEQEEGHIKSGHKSGLACNWWKNAEVDFDLAAQLGLNAMRLSIEWSRVEPQEGYLNLDVMERYRAMLQALRDRGIEPMVTLHHFSNPLWLEEYGAWENPIVVDFFVRYVTQVIEHLGNDATASPTLWCTINEPNVYAYMGYLEGSFPPGKHRLSDALAVLRNMIKAHAAAYKAIHRVQPEARVGLAHNFRFFDPARPHHLLDRFAAWVQDLVFNRATLAPLGKGGWTLPLGIGPALRVARTLDWIGINYYTRDLVKSNFSAVLGSDKKSVVAPAAEADLEASVSSEPSAAAAESRVPGIETLHSPDAELLDGGYGELYPEGLSRAIKRVGHLGLPIYITENGIPDSDDDQRPRAIVLHLHQLWRALQDNYPVMGYYHWTLTDNFEWAEGWTLPFGLIELDRGTQQRIPRPSADLYGAIARGNAITPELVDAYTPELRPTLMPA
jgi:beta-glucosidase